MDPKASLIILDIDGVIIDFSVLPPDRMLMNQKQEVWIINGVKYYVFVRPGFYEFLEFCRKNFKYIAVWTLGNKVWANTVVKRIFPKNFPLLFVWNWEHAGPHYSPMRKYKNLQNVWNKYGSLGLGKENTILIEDTIENCGINKGNCIKVKPYSRYLVDNEFQLLAKFISAKLLNRNFNIVSKVNWRNFI